MALFGVATIAAYVAVAGVANAQPPTQPYSGWISVLQSAGQAAPEQIELRVEAVEPGAPGDHPALKYSVLACGNRPFHGVLLMGGLARLGDAAAVGDTSEKRVLTLEEVPNLTLGQGENSWGLGAAQLLQVTIDELPPCMSVASPGQALRLGTGYTVVGAAEAPVQRPATFLGLSGPRSSQVWPLIGGFPGVPPGNFGEFRGIDGLPGAWNIPSGLHKHVTVGRLGARASVEGALPPLADTSQLAWSSSLPLRPTLRLVNIDALGAWQQGLVAAGIGLGIGASLLASLLFEWTRPTQVGAQSIGAIARVRTACRTSRAPSNRLRPVALLLGGLLVVSVALVSYLLTRSRRQ